MMSIRDGRTNCKFVRSGYSFKWTDKHNNLSEKEASELKKLHYRPVAFR